MRSAMPMSMQMPPPSSRYGRAPPPSTSTRGRSENATFATPLTAERAMMERIRCKLEKTQVRLANDQARSSVQQHESLMGSSHHYFPPDYTSTRAPAPAVQSVKLEDYSSAVSSQRPSAWPHPSRAPDSRSYLSQSQSMRRGPASRRPSPGPGPSTSHGLGDSLNQSQNRWRMSRYADENQRRDNRAPTPPSYHYQSSSMLPPPPSSTSFVVYSSSRGSIPMDQLFPVPPASSQPKSILMHPDRSQRMRSFQQQLSSGEDATVVPPPPGSRVRFEESACKESAEIAYPPLVEEEDEDARDSMPAPPQTSTAPETQRLMPSPRASKPRQEEAQFQMQVPKPRQEEPRSPKPRQTEPRAAKPRQPEARSPNPRQAESRSPRPRQDDTRRNSLVADPPKSEIKISAFDKFFGRPFWVSKGKRDKDATKSTRPTRPQSPIAASAMATTATTMPRPAPARAAATTAALPAATATLPAVPAAATPAATSMAVPKNMTERAIPTLRQEREISRTPSPRLASEAEASSPSLLFPLPHPAAERQSDVSSRASIELSPLEVHAENASTLVVLDTEEDDATFLSSDEFVVGEEHSIEPLSATDDDATFVLPRREISKDEEDPVSDDEDEFGTFDPPINSTASSYLSDECLPPHLAYLLEEDEEASYATDEENWPSSLESVHPLSGDVDAAGSNVDKKPPPSSLSNDLEYLLALARACQDEYASSARDSILSSYSEPSDVYSSTNSLSVLPSPPPSTRERALSDPQSANSVSSPPPSSHLPRARPVVTSTIQRMSTRERWVDDEPVAVERWVDGEEEDDEKGDVFVPECHAMPSQRPVMSQRPMPSRIPPPPPSARPLSPLAKEPTSFHPNASFRPNGSTRSIALPPPSYNSVRQNQPPSISAMLSASYSSQRGNVAAPPSSRLSTSIANLRAGIQPPPITSTMLSSSQASVRSTAQQPPRTSTMISTSYASMRASYGGSQRTLPRAQSEMLSSTPAAPVPATTRPTVSRPRDASSVMAAAPQPASSYVPLRQRAKTATSLRRPLPPSIGALSALAQGSVVFSLDPKRFYQIEWTTGEFAFSFQRVYGPADPTDPNGAPPMFLRMLLNTDRGTCPNFAQVRVGDVLVQIGNQRVCDLGVDSSSALTKLFANLQRQTPLRLVFQRMDADEWEGGVEL